jgi:hypothetical protein
LRRDHRVSGDDCVRLECPFRGCRGTFCTGCRKYASLDAFTWVDSDETIAAYRKRIYDSVPFWEQVRLAVFANAYAGALNLNLDRTGAPRPGPSTFDIDANRTAVPAPASPIKLTVVAGALMFVLGWAACGAAWAAEARWQKQDPAADVIAMGGTFLWGAGAALAVFGLVTKTSPPESQ